MGVSWESLATTQNLEKGGPEVEENFGLNGSQTGETQDHGGQD
jgi:hypothetical protein